MTAIDQPLWTGSLVPDIRRGATGKAATGPAPELTIGRPTLLGDGRTMLGPNPDAATAALLERNDYHLVRFACSFRTTRKVQSATFNVQLIADDVEPIAFDLYPMRVDQKVQHNVKLSFAPNLKFGAVNVGTGSVDLGVTYDQLQPTIIAQGIQESQITWVFSSATGAAPVGSQQLLIVIETPRGTPSCRADVDFSATVEEMLWRLDSATPATPFRGVPLWPQ